MPAIELELLIAIYALYLFDCLHWLKPGEAAFMRRFNGEWQRKSCHPEAYTLLGRMPILRNPFDLRPGWLISPAPDSPAPQLNRFIEESLPHRRMLTALLTLSAFNLLILLPTVIALNILQTSWRLVATLILITHITVAVEFIAQSTHWRRTDPKSFWREFLAILLNPINALRSADTLCSHLFHLSLTPVTLK